MVPKLLKSLEYLDMMLSFEYHEMLSFLPTFKLGRMENMTAAVIRCVQHLCIMAPNQKPWKLTLLCHAINEMRNKLLIDIIMSCYIPDPISNKIILKVTTKMCN
jgi:hypothetical protein